MLSAGGDRITMRCTQCRQSHSELLPEIDKKLVYLDQFVFSNLFHLESGEREPRGNVEFWREIHQRLKRLVLLQQILLPHSDVHHLETLVWEHSSDLRQCYEHFGGDARLIDTNQVALSQTSELASAFVEGRKPNIERGTDHVLERGRKEWLKDMRIFVDVDYSQFKDDQLASNERSSEALDNLVAFWREKQPSYDDVLELELGTHAQERQSIVNKTVIANLQSEMAGNALAILDIIMSPVMNEYSMLLKTFQRAGFEEKDIATKIYEFWDWAEHREQPESLIAAHMFAGMARKVVGGQKGVGGGFLNDVRAIATYAPQVDAMFIDKECHTLLREADNKLNYRAQIFSLNSQDEFLAYLDEIEAGTSDEVRNFAHRIYGI